MCHERIAKYINKIPLSHGRQKPATTSTFQLKNKKKSGVSHNRKEFFKRYGHSAMSDVYIVNVNVPQRKKGGDARSQEIRTAETEEEEQERRLLMWPLCYHNRVPLSVYLHTCGCYVHTCGCYANHQWPDQ